MSIGSCPAALPDFLALCARLRHYPPKWALGKESLAMQSVFFSALCVHLRHYPPWWALAKALRGKLLQTKLLLSGLCARLRHYPLRCVSGSALQSCLILLLSARVCAITHPGGHWVKLCKAIRISLLSAYICAITHAGGHWVKPHYPPRCVSGSACSPA